MSEREREFDALVKLHTEIKSFKIEKSAEILKKFHSTNEPKFKLTAEEKEEFPRLNLSSTTVCAYALSQYLELLDEAKKFKFEFPNLYWFSTGTNCEAALNAKSTSGLQQVFINNGFSDINELKFISGKDNEWTITDGKKIFVVKKEGRTLKVYHAVKLKDYYTFIITGLDRYLDKSSSNSELESTDEFSLLNALALLKGIQEKISEKNKDFKEENDVVIRIIRMLCKQFIKNRFSSFGSWFRSTLSSRNGERPHPFIYYKFLLIIRDWAQEIFDDIQKQEDEWTTQKDEEWNEFVKKVKVMKEEEKEKVSKAIFDYFFSEAKIYDDAKYEMYRQIALYNAADMSLFDVKRLIYSLLLVKSNNKYS